MFKMKTEESITKMFTRFTDIINRLKSLGKVYSNSEQVRKILRSMPRNWEAKVTAIEEAKNLNALPLEELLGSLMTKNRTHKMMIKRRRGQLLSNLPQMNQKVMKRRMNIYLSSPKNLRGS